MTLLQVHTFSAIVIIIWGVWNWNHCQASNVHGIQPYVGGGIDVVIDSFPYAVAIFKQQQDSRYYLNCSGSIISKKNVLTSASCCLLEPDVVVVGATDTLNNGEAIGIANFTSHPYFEHSKVNIKDICIIALSAEFKSSKVKPVNLLPLEQTESLVNLQMEGELVGWGKTSTRPVSLNQLQLATYKYISQKDFMQSMARLGYGTQGSGYSHLYGEYIEKGLALEKDDGASVLALIGETKVAAGIYFNTWYYSDLSYGVSAFTKIGAFKTFIDSHSEGHIWFGLKPPLPTTTSRLPTPTPPSPQYTDQKSPKDGATVPCSRAFRYLHCTQLCAIVFGLVFVL